MKLTEVQKISRVKKRVRVSVVKGNEREKKGFYTHRMYELMLTQDITGYHSLPQRTVCHSRCFAHGLIDQIIRPRANIIKYTHQV